MPVYALGDQEPALPPADQLWVAPDAHVIGNVRLGAGVGIWFCAVLRGDNDLILIGDGTNIQDGAVLHSDPGFPLTIGRLCTIGHRAIVHGCTIGDRSLIGMGATVMNGASIGANCIVGANALVTEGKSFPDRSLIVGAPAKVVRTLDDAALAGLWIAATGYIEKGQRFRTTLRRLD